MTPTTCPACHANWDAGPIPEQHREHYAPPYRWSRRISVYSREMDRTVALRCPDCGDEVAVESAEGRGA